MPLPGEIIPITRIAERPGTGHITFSKSGLSASRKWVCPWYFADGRTYLDFVQQLLGMTISGPNRIPVITYPDAFSPELPFLYCMEVDVEGEDLHGTDAWGRAVYRRAICTAKYMPYEMGESFHLAAQMFTCTEGSHCFIGTPTAMPQRPAHLKEDALLDKLARVSNAVNKLDQILNAPVIVDINNPVLPPQQPGAAPQMTDAQRNIFNQQLQRLFQQEQALRNQLGNNTQGLGDLQNYLNALENWVNNQVMVFTNPGISAAMFAQTQGAANVVSIPVGKVIPLGEYTIERHFVMQPNFIQWISMMGCTNAYYFLGYPPWTLLFSGLDGKRALLPNGTRCWDITMKFLFNPNGHNLIYRAPKGRWEVIVSLQTSTEAWLTAGLTGFTPIQTPVHKYLYRPIDYAPFLNYT